jgi:ABC-type multidrug transport system permease subunit
MTQSQEDISQMIDWVKGAIVVGIVLSVVLYFSPLFCDPRDPYQLIRYCGRQLVAGLLCCLILSLAYVRFDQVFPGSMSAKIGENAIATSILASSVVLAVALILTHV